MDRVIAARNFTPIANVSAGSGSARMNSVITGAMKESPQPTACETHIDRAVPVASRRIRTWAISMAGRQRRYVRMLSRRILSQAIELNRKPPPV